MSEKLSNLPALPSPITTGDNLYVIRGGVSYKADNNDLPSGGSGGQVDSVVGGTDITVDATDPINPIVNFTGTTGGQVDTVTGGTDITVTGTATDPIINFSGSTGTGTVTSVAVSGSDGIEIDSGSPITTSGTIALGLNQATTKTFLDYTEEEIDGTAIYDASLSALEVVDLSTHTDAYYILTVNTDISVTNPPAIDTSFVRTWTIKSSGTETLALPVAWTVIGSYLATGVENYLTIRFSNFTTAGAKVVAYITQA